MKNYSPPIQDRTLDELMTIVYSQEGDWQDDAKIQAKTELEKWGIEQEKQSELLEKNRQRQLKLQKSYEEQLERNAIIPYSRSDMLIIFLKAPFIIVGRWSYQLSIPELRRENFQIKTRQRLILLITGTLFWILFIYGSYKWSEYNRLQEIENADISDWEENRIIDE